ncbi:MAG: hypothetical protein GOU98_00290 [Candidatus Altiarchaeota archaeon]|nr:hypothetical protein [Candidatus Altiarchaeota archaeon]
MKLIKKDYIFVGLIIIALIGGFIWGLKPWETTKSPKEHLAGIYGKLEVDGIKLYQVERLTENCAIGHFYVDTEPKGVVVCLKDVTLDEIKVFGGEEASMPPFIGRIFDYAQFSLSFGDESTEVDRIRIGQIVGRVINYVEN